MCPSSERVNKICAPHTVDTREMTVVHDDVSRIVSRQQELKEHVIQMRASVDELRNQLEQMSTRLDIRWNGLEEPQGTSLEEPKESSKTYV